MKEQIQPKKIIRPPEREVITKEKEEIDPDSPLGRLIQDYLSYGQNLPAVIEDEEITPPEEEIPMLPPPPQKPKNGRRTFILTTLIGITGIAAAAILGSEKKTVQNQTPPANSNPEIPKPNELKLPATPSVNTDSYSISKNSKELKTLLSEKPDTVYYDPSLKTDDKYIIISKPLEEKPEINKESVSAAWREILNSPFTGNQEYQEQLAILREDDPEGVKDVSEFLITQMKNYQWKDADLAIRMGGLALDLNPEIKDRIIAAVVFLNSYWAEEKIKLSNNPNQNPENNNNPNPEKIEQIQDSKTSEEEITKELQKTNNNNIKPIMPSLKISLAFTPIGPVDFAKELAHRTGLISSVNDVMGPGIYRITKAKSLPFTMFGQQIKFLEFEVVKGDKLPKELLWALSITNLEEGNIITGRRIFKDITGL